MKTYKCEYGRYIDGNLVAEKIQAESHREAYEKFLANQGVFPEAVVVTSGFMDGGTIFDDHVESAEARVAEEKAHEQATAIRNQTATEDAEASLSSTDILLKQQIAKLEEIRVIAVWFWWWFIGLAIIGIVLFLLLLTGALVFGGR